MQTSEFDRLYLDARRSALRDYDRIRREALAKLDAQLAGIRNAATEQPATH